MISRLVLASNNAGKLREFRRLLAPLAIDVIAQAELGIAEAPEPHITFVENALAKARHASRQSGWPALADDSGICVDALGGAPGVQSARYAGEPRSDARNNARLVAALAGVDDRRAHYACVLVLVRHADDPEPLVADGRWYGRIVDTPRGSGGFGYDPHFEDDGTGLTGAELPLALYVHLPWCLHKCPYCDFNSHEARGDVPEDAYVAALLRDLELALPKVWGRRVVSVFLGGGTPSLFSADAIDRLLAGIRARLPLVPAAEITLEANPGTFERRTFAGYFAAGVNRLSLGIQSFDPAQLRALGRVHDADEARRAAEAALMIFGNVNFDLMYALPNQTVEDAQADLAAALAFAPPHLSFYHLTLEPNTVFFKSPPPLPDEDTSADIEGAVHATLAHAGYEHYETSAYARPGQRCQHNLNYWQFGDYLGIGAGAHSKLSYADRIERELRWKQPKQYLAKLAADVPLQESRVVTRDEVGFEFMLNAMRLTAGVPATAFGERTGYSLAIVARGLETAIRKGLLESDPLALKPTPLGRRFLNDLVEIFLPERPAPRAAKTTRIRLDATGHER